VLEPEPSRVERFDRLYEEHFEAVRRYLCRRDPGLAEDAVAETFLVAWRRLDDVPRSERAWLIGVARNVRLNLRRTTDRQRAVTERLVESRADADVTLAGASQDVDAVSAALERLSPADREVLLLSAWDDLDRSSIAEVLGCTKAGVSVRLHRARRRFAAALDGPSPIPDALASSPLTSGGTDG
jgi:RNA polymerase sigma-70 factor, ECF subfamily